MKVQLNRDQTLKLISALNRAGRREIGGQLFGEQLAPSHFKIIELTIQARPGTFSRFVVDLMQAVRDSIGFFDRTQHRYQRFNYIGEWHSHPSFAVQPSAIDKETMWELVLDQSFHGNFAVLMIVRLDADRLTKGAWVFDPQGREHEIHLEVADE